MATGGTGANEGGAGRQNWGGMSIPDNDRHRHETIESYVVRKGLVNPGTTGYPY